MKYIISNPNNDARLGHQFQNMSVSIALSLTIDNLEHLHTPFSGPSSKWEKIFNFPLKIKTKKDIKPKKIIKLPRLDFGVDVSFPLNKAEKNIAQIKKIIDNESDETLFILPKDLFPGILSKEIIKIAPLLKECYWSNKKKYDFKHDGTTIGIHIRRGDIKKHKQAARWLEVTDYLKVMNTIREKNIYNSPRFIIFAESGETKTHNLRSLYHEVYDEEGKPSDFKLLKSEDVDFSVGGSDIETFHKMVSTDVLMSGLSTFPILAAYINYGETIYWKLRNYNKWENIKGFINVDNL